MYLHVNSCKYIPVLTINYVIRSSAYFWERIRQLIFVLIQTDFKIRQLIFFLHIYHDYIYFTLIWWEAPDRIHLPQRSTLWLPLPPSLACTNHRDGFNTLFWIKIYKTFIKLSNYNYHLCLRQATWSKSDKIEAGVEALLETATGRLFFCHVEKSLMMMMTTTMMIVTYTMAPSCLQDRRLNTLTRSDFYLHIL